ncbi:Uncharacterised protein [Achromobacter xylosoxidans]|nr:Uncharacterised protein [Achromobacter xylosoxidans]
MLLGTQLLDGRGVVVELEAPVAVGVDGERAVLALEVGLRAEHGLAGIRIGDVELAGSGQGGVFLDGALVVARLARGDHGAVAGAVDGDGDDLGGLAAVAIVHGHDDGVGQVFTVLERLDIRIGVVELVGPLAVLVERERTVLALAVVVQRPGVRVVGVDVVLGQLTGGDVRTIFLDGARGRAADGRGVVGAVDGDDDLARGAVGAGDREGLGQVLLGTQLLDGRGVVVELEAPVAVGVDGERAVLALEVGLRAEHGLAGIRIGDVELAGSGQGGVFLDGALVVARLARGDDGGVVGTGDIDGDGLGGGTAMAVIDGHGDGVGDLLAFGQRLNLGAVVVEHVGPLAVLVDGELAVLAVAVVADGPGVRVGSVDVGDVQLAGGAGGAVLGHGAVGLAAQLRIIVGAVDGDGDGALGAIGGGDGEGLDQLLAHGQGLDLGIVVVEFVLPVAVGVDGELAVLALGVGLRVEGGFAGVLVGHVQLAAGDEVAVFLDVAGVVARLGGGDLGRVIDADHGYFHGGGGGRAAGVGDHVGNRGGRGLALRQMLEAGARHEHVAAVRLHDEGAAVGAGDSDAIRRHGPAVDRDQAQRIAVGIAVVDQQVAAHGALFIGAGNVIDGQGRVVVVARGAAITAGAAGGAVDRVGATARIGVGQVQRAGGFQDAGQAHEAAAAVVAAAAGQGGGGRIQHVERILARLQGRQQAVGVGALGRGHGRFGRVGQRAGHVLGDRHRPAFADHDRHAIFHLQRHRGARCRDDVAAGGHLAALVQLGQGTVAIAYPRATGDFVDDCGGGVGHVGSVSGSYPRWPRY